MRILYDTPPLSDIMPALSVTRDADTAYIGCDNAKGAALAYLAAGSLDSDGIFTPFMYTLKPTAETVLTAPNHPQICVQAVDHAGRMAWRMV